MNFVAPALERRRRLASFAVRLSGVIVPPGLIERQVDEGRS